MDNADVNKPDELILDVQQEGNYLVLKVEDKNLDTSQEEDVIMSREEMGQYIAQKVAEKMQQAKFNACAPFEQRIAELEREIKTKEDEHKRLLTMFDKMFPHQIKFLRQKDVFKKIPTRSVACHEDLPTLTETLSKENTIIKNYVSIAPSPTKPPEPATPVQSVEQTSKKPKTDSIECIDLTDEMTAVSQPKGGPPAITAMKHPAPLPLRPFSAIEDTPAKPTLRLSSEDRGIVLQWDMPPSSPHAAKLKIFEIFGYQEIEGQVINSTLWKKIGFVEAMTLPMACTLMQFIQGNKYHFSIRAVDVNGRPGFYSDAISVIYGDKGK